MILILSDNEIRKILTEKMASMGPLVNKPKTPEACWFKVTTSEGEVVDLESVEFCYDTEHNDA